MDRPLRIAFLHPDLGIGGGERVVVDAALYLQQAGHKVTIFTSHHDRSYCFEETRDGTLDVRIHGSFLPMQMAQHFRAPLGILRASFLACVVAFRGERFDILFCDLIPHVIPLLRLVSRAKIIYYCHHPDLLVAPARGLLYRFYRAPINLLEEIGANMSDRVLANSQFTASEFRRALPRLRGLSIEVLHPGTVLTSRSRRKCDLISYLLP
jgi:alpha-1,3/alpha-1,6-mannosyltransferase